MNREQFLGLGQSVKVRPVNVEWSPEPLYFRELTGSERTKYFMWLQPKGEHDAKRAAHSNAKLVSLTLCDPNGVMLLSESDFDTFESWPAWQQDPVIKSARVFSGIDDESPETYVNRIKKKSNNSPEAIDDTHN